MSTYGTPDIATLYGGLDTTAITDGEAYNAHVLRVLAASSNRLATLSHVLLNQAWPVADVLENQHADHPVTPPGGCADIAAPWYRALFPPIFCRKMAGTSLMDIKILARIDTGPDVIMQITTNASPYAHSARVGLQPNVVAINTDATWATYTLTGLAMDRADSERIGFYARAEPTNTLGATASYGTPNTAATVLYLVDRIIVTGASWNLTAGTGKSWPEGGHLLRFISTLSGGDAVPPRLATMVPDAETIVFEPSLTLDEMMRCMTHAATLRIETLQRYSVANISAIARFV